MGLGAPGVTRTCGPGCAAWRSGGSRPSAGRPLTCRGGPNQPVAEPHAKGHLRVHGSHVVSHQLQQQQQQHADQPQPSVTHPADRRWSLPSLDGGPRPLAGQCHVCWRAFSLICFLLFPKQSASLFF